MKKILFTIVLFVLALAVPASALLVAGFALPAQYEETYYGELSPMVRRLKNAEGKKIVLIGGSSLAFGLDVDLLESNLEGYTVCPFGLYGAIGTKAMLDLAKPYIGEGDIVIVALEPSEQTMSLYFSAAEFWCAADGDFSLLTLVAKEDRSALVGGFVKFAADKFGFFSSGKKPKPEGVYARASFDENCCMIYPREYNVMPLYYDENAPVSFSPQLLQEDFVDYLNDYYIYCHAREAQLFYNFSPVNALAVEEGADLDAFFAALCNKLDFPVLSDPHDYIFDWEWFYDSNFHMNSAGMTVYTAQLLKDIRRAVDDGESVEIELPEKPQVPSEPAEGEGEDAACFEYEQVAAGLRIVGLTAEDAARETLRVPAAKDGQKVCAIAADAFAGGKVREIVIPQSVTLISDGAFRGCEELSIVRMLARSPNSAVGGGLLDGTDADVYVPDYDSYAKYVTDYYWAHHADRIKY